SRKTRSREPPPEDAGCSTLQRGLGVILLDGLIRIKWIGGRSSQGTLPDLYSTLVTDHQHVGDSCKETTLDNAGELLDCNRELRRIRYQTETAVYYVVSIVSDERPLEVAPQSRLAAQFFELHRREAPRKRK